MQFLRKIKRRLKSLARAIGGNYRHLQTTVSIPRIWYGNDYGGFYICPSNLDANSIVYSFGVGEDVSFDLACIQNHNCHVFAFDPTPRVAKWIQGQSLPAQLHFHNCGIGSATGVVDFFLPNNEENVSGSFVLQRNVGSRGVTKVPMKSLSDIVTELRHQEITVLKMDIEGIEYDILDSILGTEVRIQQILIEFHDRFFPDGRERTAKSIALLNQRGYELFGVADTGEELSFVNVHSETFAKFGAWRRS